MGIQSILNFNPLDIKVKKLAALLAIRLENFGFYKRSIYGNTSILNESHFGIFFTVVRKLGTPIALASRVRSLPFDIHSDL
uniref:Uncharacterized protein n=1 Tax=Megaselia scalaris TaxID=36166 RepID=T1GB55_MEGSC